MTREERDRGDAWTPRPFWARVVCVFASLAPVVVGATVAIQLSTRLPSSSSLVATVLRVLIVVVASTGVVYVVDRAARRLLPLAALYRLSLVFPDHAPSRFRTALKAGSSRRVERLIAETRRSGLPQDPGAAARRVVELINAIGDHDRRTRGHSERVRLYADLIGEELHLSAEERQKLQWAALLHDLGKLSVPAEILNKKGAPDNNEWAILRSHPSAGERLVLPLRPFLGAWADAVGGHHEWWNGTGYPRQLKGDQISQSAAIVAVADAYEVMTAVRSYKKSMPASTARAELTRGSGVQFSPEVVRAFLCVSLGRLRWVAGPVASLAQIPYIGSAVRFPGTVGTAIQGVGNIAAAAAPSMAAVMVATTAVASSIAVTPPAHTAKAAKTIAYTKSTKKTHGTTSPTTMIAGISAKASTPSGKAATTSTTVGNGTAARVADNTDVASDTSGEDGNGDSSTVDTTPDTTPTTVAPVDVIPVTVSIGDVSTPEGDVATRVMTFPVMLTQPTNTTMSVHYAVTSVTATVGAKPTLGVDVKLRSGTLTFTPDEDTGKTALQKNISVTIAGDTDVEGDETFNVTLSDPSFAATIGRSVATGTILDDDDGTSGVKVGVGDASVMRAATRPIWLTIPVWLSAPCDTAVTVGFTVSDGSATWSSRARDGGDYGGVTTGLLSFDPGTVAQGIQLKIWPDVNPRPERTFTISLTSSDGGTTVVRAHGTVTIYGT